MLPKESRYWIFISYSHGDKRQATRVQQDIENFTIPASLRTASTRFASLPARLRPVFRDRDVLASSHDLSAEIQNALTSSESLLVICSRSAAKSKWVAREVELFIELNGPENIFCLLVDGEPNCAEAEGECLPEPLRRSVSGRDVLAADVRAEADGRRQALLKILAGVTALPYERLARREQKRARQRMLVWSTAAILLAAGFGLLAFNANIHRAEAEREARRASLTADYLTSVLLQFLPRSTKGIPTAALIPLIDSSASPERLATLEQEPVALLKVRSLLALAYLQLEQPEKALPLFEANAALTEATNGPDSMEAMECLFNLGNTYITLGQATRAEPIFRSLLDKLFNQKNQVSAHMIPVVSVLGVALSHTNRYDEARALYEKYRPDAHRFFAEDEPSLLDFESNYANALMQLGLTEESLEIMAHSAEVQNKRDHQGSAMAALRTGQLGRAYHMAGKFEAAEKCLRSSLESLAAIFGTSHSDTLRGAYQLSMILHESGRQDEADELSQRFFGNPYEPEKGEPIGDDNEVPPQLPTATTLEEKSQSAGNASSALP